MALRDQEKLFADQYIKLGNATQAALAAGYSKNTAKDASRWINPDEEKNAKKRKSKSKYKPELCKYIDEMMASKKKDLIADQDEVLQYLTSVLRGESQSTEIVVEGTGDGCSEARTILKKPSEKDRLKAAELLGKRYGLYTEKVETDVDMDLNIYIDYGDDSE